MWTSLREIVEHALAYLLAHLALLALVAVVAMFPTSTGIANLPPRGKQECPARFPIQPIRVQR
jgi:hypothetical protein